MYAFKSEEMKIHTVHPNDLGDVNENLSRNLETPNQLSQDVHHLKMSLTIYSAPFYESFP